jgi:hypothetical protein
MVTYTALLPDFLLVRLADAAPEVGARVDPRAGRSRHSLPLPARIRRSRRGGTGLACTAVNGEAAAVALDLLCLGFFGSRPLRF